MNIVEIPIEKIRTDLCVRERYGDLSSMIRTIDDYGLLHPVGITKDYQLVYGRRRLQCCRKMGWTTIPAVFVADVNTPFSIMKVENQFRQDLTPEEQVVLAQKLEEEGRRNAPAFWRSIGVIKDEPGDSSDKNEPEQMDREGDACHDRDKPDCKDKIKSKADKSEPISQVWGNFPKPDQVDRESQRSQRSDSLAAKAAGLGDRKTYRKAETVVNQGSQPLKDAMNQKKVSIDAAYQLSKLPEEEQFAIDYDDKQSVKEKVRQLRKPPEKPDMNKSDISRVVKLTSDWPEEQLLKLIEALKKQVKGKQ